MIPQKNKYKKYHKINIKNKEEKQIALRYGNFGIKAKENGYIKLVQIERIKADLLKKLKDKMDFFFNFYPLYGLTSKGTARMGAGKGDVVEWYVPVQKGKILVEFINTKMTKNEMKKIIKYSSHKWPILIQLTNIQINFKEKI